jgi:hypothetical protein
MPTATVALAAKSRAGENRGHGKQLQQTGQLWEKQTGQLWGKNKRDSSELFPRHRRMKREFKAVPFVLAPRLFWLQSCPVCFGSVPRLRRPLIARVQPPTPAAEHLHAHRAVATSDFS